ncbi:MAG: hypothetical protein COU68_00330 [Candidatus Pacebacteria bacterium CG10_big_fil_rev_8_21_14_0_10_45_6]|nr:MAG: hypothetical protein COU68_00330 [Candidatus Pacebacteria bacterium CG10_big_fil_rev_8_21_14_0_10_45_6]
MPAAYLLDHLTVSSGIPSRLRLLHLAQSLGAPVAPTLYIPPASLFGLFLEQAKIKKLLEERVISNDDPATVHLIEAKILQFFQKEQLLPQLAKSIADTYHQNLHGSFVRLFVTKSTSLTNQTVENILGDSNVLESITQASHSLLELALAASRSLDSTVLSVASGLCIQTQLQATSSGTAQSKDPNHPEKNVFAISARYGVRPVPSRSEQLDWYEVHKSSLQEIAAEIGKKTTAFKREPDSLQKIAVATKQQTKRILQKSRVEFLAALTAKISQKEFLPLLVQWETQKDVLFITEISELDQLQVGKQVSDSKTTQTVVPESSSWIRVHPSWKINPDAVSALVQDLAQSHLLEPTTNIIIPQVTTHQELETIRESLLDTKLSHQNRNYWPELASVGVLHSLKKSTALDFFAGVILDIPSLLQSLFVTPTWSEEEHNLLFSLIEQHVPTHISRGITLSEITPSVTTHLSNQIYTHVHAPTNLAQKLHAILSDLELERWNALP